MSIYDNLTRVDEEIVKCMKCGNCQAVCPLYAETKSEGAVARGKVQLAGAVLHGRLSVTEELVQKFDLCLTCKACQANCPCGVHVEDIVLAARAEMVRQKGLPWVKNAIFQVLKRPALFDLGLKTGSVLQGAALSFRRDGLASPRFPVGLDTRRILSPLAKKALRSQLPEVNRVTKPRARVAYFTGCMENYIYTDIGLAVVEVLKANDVEVVIPAAQHCCGIPVLMHGDLPTAQEMAADHVRLFAGLKVDAIITACATCLGAWRHYYPDLLEGKPEAEDTSALAAKTYDINEYLVDVLDYRRPAGEVPLKVTYHDPCHMVRGQKVTSQPRQILSDIPGVDLIEMQKPDRCCGGAGSFSLTHYDLSLQINQRKTEDIRQTGAQEVITSCPACRMQLTDGLAQSGYSGQVVHTVQLLARSYAAEKEGTTKSAS